LNCEAQLEIDDEVECFGQRVRKNERYPKNKDRVRWWQSTCKQLVMEKGLV